MNKNEIEFRGKRLDNGEWVYGLLWLIEKNYILIVDKYRFSCEVDPKTLGQYVGARDIYNKKIYEGDIIKQTVSGEISVVSYDYDFLGFKPFFFVYEGYKVYEIIGNIYDNPELLKEYNKKKNE